MKAKSECQGHWVMAKVKWLKILISQNFCTTFYRYYLLKGEGKYKVKVSQCQDHIKVKLKKYLLSIYFVI